MTINTKQYSISNNAASALSAAATQINQAAQSNVSEAAKNKISSVADRVKLLEAKSLADAHQVKDAGTRFQDNNFGRVVGANSPGSTIDVLRGSGAAHSRNPLDQQGNGFLGDRNSKLSEDPKAGGEQKSSGTSPDWWEGFKEAAGEIVGEVAGTIGGFAWDVLNANDTPEGKKNEFNGILGLVRQGRTGSINENESEQLRNIDYGGEPRQDDETPSGKIYGSDLKGIAAKKGAAGTPTGEENTSGSTGPVNTGANGTGAQGAVSQPVPDQLVSRVAVTARDLQSIQVRIDSKINHVR